MDDDNVRYEKSKSNDKIKYIYLLADVGEKKAGEIVLSNEENYDSLIRDGRLADGEEIYNSLMKKVKEERKKINTETEKSPLEKSNVLIEIIKDIDDFKVGEIKELPFIKGNRLVALGYGLFVNKDNVGLGVEKDVLDLVVGGDVEKMEEIKE
jgi:hypothetical protein